MNESSQPPLFKRIHKKSVSHLTISPDRSTLNKRMQQVEGMIEIIKHLPEYAELIEPLEQHHQWLKAKVKAWPV